jgi:hypothetical protein
MFDAAFSKRAIIPGLAKRAARIAKAFLVWVFV